MKKVTVFIMAILFFSGCQEKERDPVIIKANMTTPISCLKLNNIDQEDALTEYLKKLYPFKDECRYTVTLTYKKDIVCNSSYNVGMKSMGKFPKSFIQLEVRRGLDTLYSYYQDLYNNIEPKDIKRGFNRLKNDLMRD